MLLDLLNCKFEAFPELNLSAPMIDAEFHITLKAGNHMYTLSKTKVSMFNSKSLNWEYFCPGLLLVIYKRNYIILNIMSIKINSLSNQL